MEHNTVSEVLSNNNVPVIAIDENGLITFINESFSKAYGWEDDEVVGQVITIIMPPHMRDAHNFGFSRFLVTEHPRILNRQLQLPICCKNGQVVEAEHFNCGEKNGRTWRFAATIRPKKMMV